jgi:hypothetical protein
MRLAPDQALGFEQELARIEEERSGSNELSQLFRDSEENQVLSAFLTRARSLPNLQLEHPKVINEALRRTPETLVMAAAEWKTFSDEFYGNQGLTLPDWPQYLEIQESLGLYGRTPAERNFRRLKRNVQRRASIFVYGILEVIKRVCPCFPT